MPGKRTVTKKAKSKEESAPKPLKVKCVVSNHPAFIFHVNASGDEMQKVLSYGEVLELQDTPRNRSNIQHYVASGALTIV